jgi:negative regulator of sigma E activity
MNPQQRLAESAERAKQAEARGDDGLAAREWRSYRLIRDAARDPEELLVEGISLSMQAIELAAVGQ